MEIVFSENVQKELEKIKDAQTLLKIIKQLQKLCRNPYAGKPLHAPFKHKRSIRIPPYRLVYEHRDNKLIVLTFDHRSDVYK